MPSILEASDPDEPPVSAKGIAAIDGVLPPLKRQKSKNYSCPFEGCSKSYTKPSKLEEHIHAHTGERPFACDKCDKTYIKSFHLARHKEIHSPQKPHRCSYPGCTVSCTTRQHLKTHESLHTEPTPYQCTGFPPCTLSFRKKHLLRSHISSTHTHAPAFPCPHAEEGCQFAFNSQSKLNLHLTKRHTKRYSCDECEESFILFLDLQRHKRDDHKPRCFTCDMEFTNRETLNEHLQIHRTTLDERKKFICQYPDCTKRYTKAFGLKTHVRTVHENVKAFKCEWEGCGRAFGFKKILQRHELTHTMPSPVRVRKKVVKDVDVLDEIAGTGYEQSGREIECVVEGCEWRFVRDFDLKRHLISVHQHEYPGMENEDMDEDMDDEVDDEMDEMDEMES